MLFAISIRHSPKLKSMIRNVWLYSADLVTTKRFGLWVGRSELSGFCRYTAQRDSRLHRLRKACDPVAGEVHGVRATERLTPHPFTRKAIFETGDMAGGFVDLWCLTKVIAAVMTNHGRCRACDLGVAWIRLQLAQDSHDSGHHQSDVQRISQLIKKELVRFSVSYRDLNDMQHEAGPYSLSVEVVEMDDPVVGFSNAMVLQSGTMLHFAQNLKMIGESYYSCKTELDQVNELRDLLWRQQGGAVDYEELSSPEIRRLEQSIQSKMQRAMSITVELKKEILNARLRLDSEGFEDEIEILDNYIEILGRELKLEPRQVLRRAMENEIAPSVQKRSLQENLSNLFREMTLDLAVKPGGVVAVSGFTTRGNEAPELLSLLNEMAVVEIGRLDTLTLVERQKLAALLEEQELALSDLMDTSKAISIGRLMAADYIVTGTVVEMSTSVVIFGRIINIETGEVESVAQVIVPKDSEMKKLLA